MKAIRVLHIVVSMDVGGIETMLMNYYRNIDRSKVQFDFLLHTKHKSYFEDEILSMGGKIYRVPSYHPQHQISYRIALNRFFKEHAYYKVVHSHIGFYGMYALRAAKKQGVPLRIAHSHCSNVFWRYDISLPFRIVTRHGLKKQYTNVYACSPEAAEYMAPKKPYTIMHNAIDASAFRFNNEERICLRKKLNLTDDALLIGHVGRFTAEKNHIFILNVFQEILKLRDNVHLLLIGSGKLYDEIIQKAKDMRIYDHIIFTGVRKDIPSLMSAMDIFVFPSIFEGFGISLVEAQNSDLPCVISDTFTKASIISDKVTILSLKDSPMQWANSIVNQKITKRKDCTQTTINAGLDIKSNAKQLENFYLEAYIND